MILPSLWQAIEASPFSVYIAESTWAFPTIETIHVIALVTVVGTIMIMDLRLVGVASRDTAVTLMSRDTLPWTWGAFVLAAITGSLLFASKATSYMNNPYFLLKMGCMALAGINMAAFHTTVWKTVTQWDSDCAIPTAGKVAGFLSLFFWFLVIFFGRAIGFTLGIYGSGS